MTLTGIVLAGGRSTRMGQDKASLPFGDDTLLTRAIRLVGSVADEVIVVVQSEQGGSNLALGLAVRVVFDPIENLGPLAGIAAGLAASNSDLNLIVACDMPLIKPAVLRRLVELCGDADICVPVVGAQASPLCAVYRSSVASAAQALLATGERRAMRLLDQVITKRVDAALFRDLDPQLESFVSCNTPEELQAALTCRLPGT